MRDVHAGRTFTYFDADYNLGGLSDWETTAIGDHFPPGGRVLVTGAGAGREVLALLDQGFDAIGYEPNAALVEAGAKLLRARGHADRLRVCERDAFPDAGQAWDGVVVGWGSYMLIPSRARRVAFLQGARRALPEGGPLLCSFYLRSSGARYYARVARIANVVRRIRRAERAELGDSIADNFVHWFTHDEVGSEIADGGFEMVAFRREPYGHAIAVAKPCGGELRLSC